MDRSEQACPEADRPADVRDAAVRGWLYVGRRMKPTTLAAGLGASLPVIASTIHAVSVGVVPAGDRAIIALRADEVLSAHPPLVGQYSASSVVAGAVTHSPGPMLYWLLALPARYGSPSSLAVVIGLVNILCVFLSVALARRRGGGRSCSLRDRAGSALALMVAGDAA